MSKISASTAIKRLGGLKATADALTRISGVKISPEGVANWRMPGRSIPPHWVGHVERLLKKVNGSAATTQAARGRRRGEATPSSRPRRRTSGQESGRAAR